MTKQFAKHLMQCISYETEGKIDVLGWQCGYVATRMIKDKSIYYATATEAIDGMFRDIPHGERVSQGCMRHDLY